MNNLKKYRTEKGLTLQQVAEKTMISIGYICHLENGSRSNPSRKVMEKISFVLDKSISDIFKL